MEDKSKRNMPGPGMYQLPSDFGYVDFKKNRNLKSISRKSRNNGKNRTMTKSATYSKSHAKIIIRQADPLKTIVNINRNKID